MANDDFFAQGRSFCLCLDSTRYKHKPPKADVPGIKCRLPQQHRTPTGEALAEAISHGQTWTPALLNGTTAASWQSQQLFAVDIDNETADKTQRPDSMTVADALDVCKRHHLAPALIYESFSATTTWPRFRLVFQLPEAITDRGLCERLTRKLIHLFAPYADPHCKNLDRIYFGTAPGKIVQQWTEAAVVSVLDLDALADEPTPATPASASGPQEVPEDVDIPAMLAAIDPDCIYGTWIMIGMQLKVLGYPYEMWRDWSAQGSKFDEHGDKLGRRWASFRDTGDIDRAWRYIAKIAWSSGYRPQGPVSIYKPADFTEAGAAQLFSTMHSDIVRYSGMLGWIVWDGTRWKQSESMVNSLLIDFTDRMLADAMRENVQEQIKSGQEAPGTGKTKETPFLRFARAARSSSKVRGIQALARACKRSTSSDVFDSLTIEADKLDAHPYELNTPAGICDLRSGRMIPHDPNKLHTRITACAPGDKGATMWRDFIDLVTSNGNDADGHPIPDADLAEYLQIVAGMALIGKVKVEGLVIAHGGGSNGKSTLFNSILRVVGEYGMQIDADVLMANKRTEGNFRGDIAGLRGVRLVVCGELENGHRLSESALKRITSSDRIVGRKLYHDPEEFDPSHTVVMYTNTLPRVSAGDNGTWRRLAVVPFDATMPTGEAKVLNYGEYLAEHAGPAILQWCIEGAVKFVANGHRLPDPERVRAASDQYRNREDWLNNFLAECCLTGEKYATATIRHADLYKAYSWHAKTSGDVYLHKRSEFVEGLERLGYKLTKPHNVPTWRGIELNPETVDPRALSFYP